jgi:uncharacterized membrane protein
MDGEFLLILAVRWVHILSAALALGVPLYVHLVLRPALATLDDDNRARLHEAMAKRWRMIVHVLIVFFLATGLYNFLGVARWRSFAADDKRLYHMLFGIKVVIALAMFTISSGLAGRSAAFAFMRNNTPLWLMILILLGLGIVGVSGVMRFLPFQAN